MSPDPGSVECPGPATIATPTTTAITTTMVSSSTPTSAPVISRSTSRRQRTARPDDLPHPPDEPPDVGPSTSNSTGTLNVPLQAPNPRRHRQRLASHYLNQIRAQQSNQQSPSGQRAPSGGLPFHHYYHPYHQHHHHLHYPTYPHGFYTRAPAVPMASQTRSPRSRGNERSPFLMVKVLLFSLMTIDFVMNTIGLAVIAVMAKNHFNNLAVERSLHPPPPLDKSIPPPEDPYRNVYNHPNQGNEWTVLMPLLPSFIFVEVLTLVGMFGVFCDLFSFTMTYAILKLITSLCYPSMASTAAVAAMATASAQPVNVGVGVGSITPGNPGTSPTNIAPSLLPLPLPENFTAFLNQAKIMSLNGSAFMSPASDSVDTTTTIPPTTWSPWTPTLPLAQSAESTTLFSSPMPIATATPTVPLNSPSSTTTNPTDTNKNYKHNRLKHDKLMAQMKQMKKTEKMAKLKQREKQLRSKLLRMESAESSPSNWTSIPSSHARISLIVPSGVDATNSSFGQQHHSSSFKYHHRVWEALLCTFQVIFAVAFAFNTLTVSARRELEEGEYSDDEGGEQRQRRARRYRSSRYHWPYSPLATSIDAFYFAQFQLPPPPPPYFGAAQSGQCARSPPQRSASASARPTSEQSGRPIRSHRSLLDSHNWRRLTPSWLRAERQQSPPPPPPLSRSPSIRSMPPLYEEIDRDVILGIEHSGPQQSAFFESLPSSSATERIDLREPPPPPRTRRNRRGPTSMLPSSDSTELTESTPPESPNLKVKTENITNIKITAAEQPSSDESNANKTLVIAINESDTRV